MIFSSISDHIRRDLGQISMELARSWQIRPNLGLGDKAQNSTGRFDEYFGSVSGYIFYHMKFLSWVLVGHKLDLARPIDSPNCDVRERRERPRREENDLRKRTEKQLWWVYLHCWVLCLTCVTHPNKNGREWENFEWQVSKTLFLTTQDPSY